MTETATRATPLPSPSLQKGCTTQWERSPPAQLYDRTICGLVVGDDVDVIVPELVLRLNSWRWVGVLSRRGNEVVQGSQEKKAEEDVEEFVHAARGERAIGMNVIPFVDRAITEFEVEEKVIEMYNEQETRSKRGGTVFLDLFACSMEVGSIPYWIALA